MGAVKNDLQTPGQAEVEVAGMVDLEVVVVVVGGNAGVAVVGGVVWVPPLEVR